MAAFRYFFCILAVLWSSISFQHVNAESIQCDAGQEPASNSTNQSSSYAKPRVFILSDILNEPDDSMSLVRLLVYSNLLEIRGLCATTSFFLPNATHPEEMIKVVEAYGSVVDNLNRHVSAEFQFSPSEKLLPLVTSGPQVSCMIYGVPFCWKHSQLTLRLKGLRNRSSQRLSQRRSSATDRRPGRILRAFACEHLGRCKHISTSTSTDSCCEHARPCGSTTVAATRVCNFRSRRHWHMDTSFVARHFLRLKCAWLSPIRRCNLAWNEHR